MEGSVWDSCVNFFMATAYSIFSLMGFTAQEELGEKHFVIDCPGFVAVKVSLVNNLDSQGLDARNISLYAETEGGKVTSLNFLAGSFGIECRKNSSGWSGFLVFQTACPAKPRYEAEAAACDFENNFGIIFGDEVLIVPHERNGSLASELFNYPKIGGDLLEPVDLSFKAWTGKK